MSNFQIYILLPPPLLPPWSGSPQYLTWIIIICFQIGLPAPTLAPNTLTLLKHKSDHVNLLLIPLQMFCILFRTKFQVLTLTYKALCALASCHYSDLPLSFFLAHFYTGLLAGPQACSCLKVLETVVPSPWYAHPSEIHIAHSLTSSPLQHSHWCLSWPPYSELYCRPP